MARYRANLFWREVLSRSADTSISLKLTWPCFSDDHMILTVTGNTKGQCAETRRSKNKLVTRQMEFSLWLTRKFVFSWIELNQVTFVSKICKPIVLKYYIIQKIYYCAILKKKSRTHTQQSYCICQFSSRIRLFSKKSQILQYLQNH